MTEVINKLLTKGHRETYLKTVKKLEKKGLLELSTEEAMTNFSEDDEEFARYQDAHEMYTQYGEHGMDGWDYSRALQVLGDCYLADYINLEECLDLSLPIAKKLQSAFTSWEELADSYIYGYASVSYTHLEASGDQQRSLYFSRTDHPCDDVFKTALRH